MSAAEGAGAPIDYRTAVAVVGLAGRFPGATGVRELWANLLAGEESVRRLSEAELVAAGVEPDLVTRPEYVPAAADLDDADCFDADFFGVPGHEARLMDPQQRVFLECAWSALEDAGYSADELSLRTGVFASGSASSYLFNVLAPYGHVRPGDVSYPVLLGNDKDFLATRVSYRLGLTGPSLTVQTACSSSLTAVHLACRSLIERECAMALAGGVSISVPAGHGYLYREGGILSADGHCRPFDARAGGTVKGSGCGVVVLRLLTDALADGDQILAVIRGTAINNDGADKVGFTAPSPIGQEEVIREALQLAGVPAADIGFVEAHGTGTPLGDPIEVRALTAAHRADGPPPKRCVLGSVKANLGHLDAAAGVTGLIKTTLVLRHQAIPGQPTFDAPHPELQLSGSPYAVLRSSEPAPQLRAAAVSSFGLGGTNAHAVLVPAPSSIRPSVPDTDFQVLLSALDPAALRQAVGRLRDHLVAHPELRIDDIAFTLARGRRALPARVAFRVADTAGLIEALSAAQVALPPAADATQRSWLAGDDSATDRIGDVGRAHRVSLPGYAFRRIRHWAGPLGRSPLTAVPAPELPVSPPEPALQESGPGKPRPERSAPDGTALPLDRVCALIAASLDQAVGPDDDLLDLGADSITLVEIVTELRDDFGVPLRFEDVTQARTPRGIAGLLPGPDTTTAAPPAPPPVVAPAGTPTAATAPTAAAGLPGPAHAATADSAEPRPSRIRGGSATVRPLFLIHPAGGTTVCYSDLGRRLDTDVTLYGIGFPVGLAPGQGSVRNLARYYRAMIQRVQPRGPYLLGGYSFGGNVAVQLALDLEEEGEQVDHLLLFDSHPPEAYVGGSVTDQDYLDAFPHLVTALFGEIELPTDAHPDSVAAALELIRQPNWSQAMMRELAAFFGVWQANHQALKRHYPDHRVAAEVTVFAATEPEDPLVLERLGISPLPVTGWQAHLTEDLRVVEVPGDHYSMFRDPAHLDVLATRLDAELGRLDRRRADSARTPALLIPDPAKVAS